MNEHLAFVELLSAIGAAGACVLSVAVTWVHLQALRAKRALQARLDQEHQAIRDDVGAVAEATNKLQTHVSREDITRKFLVERDAEGRVTQIDRVPKPRKP